jgi:FHA domain
MREDVMGTLSCPSCGSAVGPADLICYTCGANLPRQEAAEDPPVPATIVGQTVRPDTVSHPISATVLRIAFPAGNVDVPAGTSMLLGRNPAESLVAAAFDGCENVSRRHATVTVDDAGNATIRDEHSTNGTFVNGDRVLPGLDVRISDGDSVRLASDVTGQVVLPAEPRPSGRNGSRV